MTQLSEDNWHNCLLYKFGFQYTDLFPKIGAPTNSESIIASSLPSEQSTPYYTIYCNLSTGEYISNTDAYQILGIIQTRFIAGDYIYGDPSASMSVMINQKVTRIQIEIRDNSG